MGKYYKALAFFFTFIPFYFLTLSCQEGGDAGDLLGQWRLEGSDDKYVAFSGSVAMFRNVTSPVIDNDNVFGNFQHRGDSLFIQCYSVSGVREDTVLVEQSFGLMPFSNIRLKVVTLDSDRLVLSKGSRQWFLRKF